MTTGVLVPCVPNLKSSIDYIMNNAPPPCDRPRPYSIKDKCCNILPLLPPSRPRYCEIYGCVHFIASRKRCISHGGGVRCKVATCSSGAKHDGLCWSHGGSRSCTVEGCLNRTKARGLCWTHGGGKPCQTPDCTKTALRHGHCWAHGGGKRCLQVGCSRPGLERHDNFCQQHFESKGDCQVQSLPLVASRENVSCFS